MRGDANRSPWSRLPRGPVKIVVEWQILRAAGSESTRDVTTSGDPALKSQTTEFVITEKNVDAQDEEQRIIDVLASVLEGLGSVVGSNTELILHDLRHPDHSTVALVNGHVTGRRIGDPIIAAPVEDKGFDLLLRKRPAPQPMTSTIAQYQSRTRDGRELASTTVLLRNRKGQPFASVCANADLTEFQMLAAVLGRLTPRQETPKATEPPEHPTVDDLIEDIIAGAMATVGKPVTLMDKAQKVRVVAELQRRGLFMIKGAADRIAAALRVTRFTVYNYLDALSDPAEGRDVAKRSGAGKAEGSGGAGKPPPKARKVAAKPSPSARGRSHSR